MNESLSQLLAGHRDAVTVKRVFGEPFQKNGVTVIPAARVMGGGGGGGGESPDGVGQGSGFGIVARPAGAYVILGNEVKWQPALDVNRLITGVLALGALALLVALRHQK